MRKLRVFIQIYPIQSRQILWINRKVEICSVSIFIPFYKFQIIQYSVTATWLRKNPTYSIYYIMVRLTGATWINAFQRSDQ